MEILNIEKRAFELMMSRFEEFAQKAEKMIDQGGNRRLGEWLDNQDACEVLSISKRTLQTLRSSGALAYSQIGHKVYYRAEDVDAFVAKRKICRMKN